MPSHLFNYVDLMHSVGAPSTAIANPVICPDGFKTNTPIGAKTLRDPCTGHYPYKTITCPDGFNTGIPIGARTLIDACKSHLK